jgi:hypothetical protein
MMKRPTLFKHDGGGVEAPEYQLIKLKEYSSHALTAEMVEAPLKIKISTGKEEMFDKGNDQICH